MVIRVFGSVFVLFGAIAVFLAVLGVVGVVAQVVVLRRKEMSIRLALGARGRGLVAALLGHTALLMGDGWRLGSR